MSNTGIFSSNWVANQIGRQAGYRRRKKKKCKKSGGFWNKGECRHIEDVENVRR